MVLVGQKAQGNAHFSKLAGNRIAPSRAGSNRLQRKKQENQGTMALPLARDNEMVRMLTDEQSVIIDAGGPIDWYQNQQILVEDDLTLPHNHKAVQTNDGVMEYTIRPVLNVDTMGDVVKEINKVPAAQAGLDVAGMTDAVAAKRRKDLSTALARMAELGHVDLSHGPRYGATGHLWRSADQEFVLGGIKVPHRHVPLLDVKRTMFEHGYDVEYAVELGRRAIEFHEGRLAAIDMGDFESELARGARLRSEQEAAQAVAQAAAQAAVQTPRKRLWLAITKVSPW